MKRHKEKYNFGFLATNPTEEYSVEWVARMHRKCSSNPANGYSEETDQVAN
jgi:hypothetical protein